MPKESEFNVHAKSNPYRAWFYFGVNATYAACFAFFVFGVWSDPCYTVNGTDAPVKKSTKDATNTSNNWKMIMFAAVVVYSLAACSSVSQCFSGKWGQRLQICDRYIGYICIGMFIAIHIMRFTHSGAVCSGDYLTDA